MAKWSFRERLEWLGRMPRHWKILFASQGMFMVVALSYRRRVINELLLEAEQEKAHELRTKELLELRDRKS